MSSAELPVSIARDAVARVLGIDATTLRADTPLVSLGWDSLACICWSDAVGEAGWRSDSVAALRAASVADLASCLMTKEASA
jgi:aryl carrier-like protein